MSLTRANNPLEFVLDEAVGNSLNPHRQGSIGTLLLSLILSWLVTLVYSSA